LFHSKSPAWPSNLVTKPTAALLLLLLLLLLCVML